MSDSFNADNNSKRHSFKSNSNGCSSHCKYWRKKAQPISTGNLCDIQWILHIPQLLWYCCRFNFPPASVRVGPARLHTRGEILALFYRTRLWNGPYMALVPPPPPRPDSNWASQKNKICRRGCYIWAWLAYCIISTWVVCKWTMLFTFPPCCCLHPEISQIHLSTRWRDRLLQISELWPRDPQRASETTAADHPSCG